MRMRVCRDSISQRCVDATKSRTNRHDGQGSMSTTNFDAVPSRQQPRRVARRDFIVGSALLTFTLAGGHKQMTPAQARAAEVPFRSVDAWTVAVIDALGEILLPGSAGAGLAHYIDHQLSGD